VTSTLDLERWPIVTSRFPPIATPEFVDRHFDDVLEIAARGPFVLVVDMLSMGFPSATIRAHAARRLQEVYASPHGSSVLGVAHVIDSSVVRGILTAVQWFAPAPFETVIVRTPAEGIEWAKRKLERSADDAGSGRR
jgi:hypothetical protein